MNIKKLVCLLLLPYFITACGEENKTKHISCESPDVLNLVAEQFKQGNPGVNNGFDYLNRLLKRGGVEVPKNKVYHEDNEEYLAIQNELKINFDNITTIRIYEDIQRYNCQVDILFEAPDGSGGTWEGKKRSFFFSTYAMNGGEKIGLEYDDSIWKEVRYSLLKQFAQSAKLDNIVWVIFSNKELEIIKEQEIKLKEEHDNELKN